MIDPMFLLDNDIATSYELELAQDSPDWPADPPPVKTAFVMYVPVGDEEKKEHALKARQNRDALEAVWGPINAQRKAILERIRALGREEIERRMTDKKQREDDEKLLQEREDFKQMFPCESHQENEELWGDWISGDIKKLRRYVHLKERAS